MPTLPTLTVSTEHFDRLVSAFPGANLTEKDAAYKKWLTNQLIDYVLAKELTALEVELVAERQRVEAELAQQRKAKEQAIIASLPPRV